MKVYSGVGSLPTGQASSKLTKGCLILEGGAFRGLYTQGALDCLMQNDINLDTVIGVSAGALAGISYCSGQIGRSAMANLGYRFDPNYIGGKALRRSHSLIRLDFLLKDFNQIVPLNAEQFYRPERRFVAVATNCNTGETMYFEKGKCSDIMDAAKASASMPFISPMVNVDGIPCLDGGCSCKIPYQWALDEGFEKIVVIRTRDRAFRKKESQQRTAERVYRHHLEFAKRLDDSEQDYNLQCEELERLEQAGRIFVLAPEQPVHVGRIERDMEKLGQLYWEGYHETGAKIESLKNYLEITE